MPISRDAPSPLHLQIAEDLRQRIRAGEFEQKSFPSLRSLAKHYETAQVTVHDAVKALQQEKLIISVSGKGTFVLPREESASAAANESENLEEQVASLRTELEDVKERLSRLEGSTSQSKGL
ncbi:MULTISPECIES: GntR family transcriptional regulator [unclassified Streptomyces]|uniref:GntR family transcriptional regulator n=1 Tax=unclassified Streptomyces TaxID=2593676 RepID=UPI002257F6DB|nr:MULTISPECIES: GntR family transcriptional regulator [unclassified Streptomyces]MCX5048250.1 GntR family transcriptional regulator [Streptomyces sp. NBC_00474]